MTVTVSHWKLGLFVVGGLCGLLGSLVWLGMERLHQSATEVHTFFDETLNGLEVGSPVKFRGVPIGRVSRIAVADDRKHLMVTTAIHDDSLRAINLSPDRLRRGDIPADLYAQFGQAALTGGSYVLVDFFPQARPPELPFPVPPNTVRSVPSVFKNLEDGLRDFLRDLPAVMSETRSLLGQLSQELRGARLPELAKRIESLLVHIDERVQGLDNIPAVASFTAMSEEVRALAASLRAEDGPIRRLQADATAVLQRIDQAVAAADVPGAARQVEAAGSTFAALGNDLRGEVALLHRLLASLDRLVTLLERDPGALLYGRGEQPSPLRKEGR